MRSRKAACATVGAGRRPLRGLNAALAAFVLGLAGLAGAQDAGAPRIAPDATAARPGAEAKTLKEKLSDKASDEQRVDNCRVPANRRGPKLRPDCPARGDAERLTAEPIPRETPPRD